VAPIVPVLALVALCACGGTGATSSSPSPSGFSNATLAGQYAFTATGVSNVTTSNGFFLVAGSLQADGNGNLSGTEDINGGTLGVLQNVSFSGTYSVGPDGRGSATVTSSGGTSTFRFVIVSSSKARIIEFDNLAGANGLLEKQDPSAFTNNAFTGAYVFGFGGPGSASSGLAPFEVTGRFLADGSGAISSGVADSNTFGSLATLQPLNGSYAVSSNGRGTMTLTGSFGPFSALHFSFYVLSGSKIRMLGLDAGSGVNPFVVLSGTAEKQQTVSLSTSTLSGDYAFVESGTTALTVGRFSADGLGGINSGAEDQNRNGTVSENVPFTGTYSISSNGRGLAALSAPGASSSFIFYAVSPGRAFAMGTDTAEAPTATIVSQQGGPFSAGSLTGGYAFDIGGNTVTGTNIDIVGQLSSAGNGNLSGVEDLHQGTALSPGVPLSGAYTVSSNGRGTVTLTAGGATSNFVFYLAACPTNQHDCPGTASPPTPLVLGIDSTFLLIGFAEKQF